MYQVLKTQYFVYISPALIFTQHVIVYLCVSYDPLHYSGNYSKKKHRPNVLCHMAVGVS